jgi:hypothetical protein
MSSGCGKIPTLASNVYDNGQHIAITASMEREYVAQCADQRRRHMQASWQYQLVWDFFNQF